MDNYFFDESREQSEVKAAIVTKYFEVWASIMLNVQQRMGKPKRIAYIDLFAGPGKYADGTESTPLLVLRRAIDRVDLRSSLVTVFNDKSRDNARALKQNIDALPGINSLTHSPAILNDEVGEAIASDFERVRFVPTLFFVDPWGYKGLTLRLLNSMLKDWGCDIIFFFNYNRINAGFSNPAVKDHIDELFGCSRSSKLRTSLPLLSPSERENEIVEELSQALMEKGGKFILPFRFLNDQGSRTSHYLVFASKSFRGYEKMKEVMATEVSRETQGVPQFQYAPVHRKQGLLFELSRPLEDLANMLLEEFAGQTLSLQQVYETHNVGRPFIKKNYKQALADLERQGRVLANPPAVDSRGHHRKGFADKVLVTFPKKRS